MGTTYVSLDRTRSAIAVPIAAVVLAALLVAGVLLAMRASHDTPAPSTPTRTSVTSPYQVLMCHQGHAC